MTMYNDLLADQWFAVVPDDEDEDDDERDEPCVPDWWHLGYCPDDDRY